MKIIEALKELKLIKAKIESEIPLINKYASALDTESLPLKEASAHKAEVKSLIQSCEDLAMRYVYLKNRIDYTNLKTLVSMKSGKAYTIAELLIMKRTTLEWVRTVYSNVTTGAADLRKAKLQQKLIDGAKEAQVLRFFDEKEIDYKKRELLELHHEIDGTLEIINATTELIEVIQ